MYYDYFLGKSSVESIYSNYDNNLDAYIYGNIIYSSSRGSI